MEWPYCPNTSCVSENLRIQGSSPKWVKACEGAGCGLKRWRWLQEENSLRKPRVRPPVQPQGSLKGWEAGTRREGQVSRSRGIRAESKGIPDLRGSYYLWIFPKQANQLVFTTRETESTLSLFSTFDYPEYPRRHRMWGSHKRWLPLSWYLPAPWDTTGGRYFRCFPMGSGMLKKPQKVGGEPTGSPRQLLWREWHV